MEVLAEVYWMQHRNGHGVVVAAAGYKPQRKGHEVEIVAAGYKPQRNGLEGDRGRFLTMIKLIMAPLAEGSLPPTEGLVSPAEAAIGAVNLAPRRYCSSLGRGKPIYPSVWKPPGSLCDCVGRRCLRLIGDILFVGRVFQSFLHS